VGGACEASRPRIGVKKANGSSAARRASSLWPALLESSELESSSPLRMCTSGTSQSKFKQ